MRVLLTLLLFASCSALDLAPLRADLQETLYYKSDALPAAVTALIAAPTPAAELVAAFAAERDPLVQFNLVIVLGKRLDRDPPPTAAQQAELVAFFAGSLAHAHPWVRVEAVYQLGRTKDAGHLAAIRRVYRDASDFAFLHAVIAVANILGEADPELTPDQLQRLHEAAPKLSDNAAATRELDELASSGVF